jgi:hypothetical protein
MEINDAHGYFANTVEVKTTLGPLPANSEVVLRMNAKPSSQQSVLSNDVDVKCQLVTDDGGIVLMRRPDPNPDVLAGIPLNSLSVIVSCLILGVYFGSKLLSVNGNGRSGVSDGTECYVCIPS